MQLTAPPYIIIESRYRTFDGDVRPIGPSRRSLEANCLHCNTQLDASTNTTRTRTIIRIVLKNKKKKIEGQWIRCSIHLFILNYLKDLSLPVKLSLTRRSLIHPDQIYGYRTIFLQFIEKDF